MENTGRLTSCTTVYNAGNTICRNLLVLDTHANPGGISFLYRTRSYVPRLPSTRIPFRRSRKLATHFSLLPTFYFPVTFFDTLIIITLIFKMHLQKLIPYDKRHLSANGEKKHIWPMAKVCDEFPPRHRGRRQHRSRERISNITSEADEYCSRILPMQRMAVEWLAETKIDPRHGIFQPSQSWIVYLLSSFLDRSSKSQESRLIFPGRSNEPS